jgi:hypothetical protein
MAPEAFLDVTTLAHDFPPASEADWRALVDKTLGEAPIPILPAPTPRSWPTSGAGRRPP